MDELEYQREGFPVVLLLFPNGTLMDLVCGYSVVIQIVSTSLLVLYPGIDLYFHLLQKYIPSIV